MLEHITVFSQTVLQTIPAVYPACMCLCVSSHQGNDMWHTAVHCGKVRSQLLDTMGEMLHEVRHLGACLMAQACHQ
eukprot:2678936-Amphidinium_carterae.1